MTPTTVFALAIGLGAFLLFQIQFLLARLVLPWFGGAPAVWSTSLVVFQALLLAGYAYAHGLAGLRSRRVQIGVHIGLLVVVLGLLTWRAAGWPAPVLPGAAWKPTSGDAPVRQIVGLLTAAVGLPFLVLASTSPLLQRWHADLARQTSPYRLYALSNLGSLAGLVTYPVLVEPRLTLTTQGWAWTVLFALYGAVVGLASWQMRDVAPPAPEAHSHARRPARGDMLGWLLLAAVPSALLQATTMRLTIDVAAVPFLWMLPLALYLGSFVVAFARPALHARPALLVFAVASAILAVPDWSPRASIAAILGALALLGVALHAELAARAPEPGWLTRYFLVVSLGGVLGSAAVALGAPRVFTGVHEYPASIAAALLVLALVQWQRTGDSTSRWGWAQLTAAMLVALALMVGLRTAYFWRVQNGEALHVSRNFFGAIRVRDLATDDGLRYRRFDHGTTMHGGQYLDESRRRMPAAYYTPASGVGQAMQVLDALGRPRRIGVIGLGAGTFAAFGRRGDALTFFEIDPDVIALSTATAPLFTYVRDSAAAVKMVPGDGRLSLERLGPLGLDLLVMDAFSSDAVPTHLLTREAMALYASHLRDARSLLVVNVTNRYLDLHDVVAATAATAGFHAVRVDHHPTTGGLSARTSWMLLARDRHALAPLGDPYVVTTQHPWTDAFSNLLETVRW